MDDHEVVPVENLRSAFALPLRPDAYNAQSARQLTVSFSLVSAHAIRDFRVGSRAYPLQLREQTPHRIAGSFTGRNVTFSEDFSIRYSLDPGKTDTLEVVTYRNPEPGAPNPTETAPPPRGPSTALGTGVEPGFFQASALLAPVGAPSAAAALVLPVGIPVGTPAGRIAPLYRGRRAAHRDRPVRHVAVDAGKGQSQLRGARDRGPQVAQACRSIQLAGLQHRDHGVAPAPVPADIASVEKALQLVRDGRLAGRHEPATRPRRRRSTSVRSAPAIAPSCCSVTPAPRTARSPMRRSRPGMRSGAPRCRRRRVPALTSSASATTPTCRCSGC